MKSALVIILLITLSSPIFAREELSLQQKQQFKEDLEFYLKTVKEDYVYLDDKKTNWDKVSQFAWKNFDNVRNRTDFLSLIERLQIELYDNHVQLLNSTMYSPKVLPSSSDIYAEYKNGKAQVINLMPNTPAFQALQINDQIISVNNKPIKNALNRFVGTSFNDVDDEIRSWALNIALAGDRGKSRTYTILRNGKEVKVNLPESNFLSYKNPLTIKHFDNIGYVRINNSLGDNAILEEFPKAIKLLSDTNGLILDLRQTQSGGNSLIARAILGHFTENDHFYQKHEIPYDEKNHGVKRSWVEIASPIKPYYSKPIVVLVNQWTGSMGEGLTIGFDAMPQATIIGAPMARLLGAMWDYRMPNSKIGFKLAIEKMYHVNGTPRESFTPEIEIKRSSTQQDDVLLKALALLKESVQ